MDVFAITCHKHICYIEANGEGEPFCPVAFNEDRGNYCFPSWYVFKSDNHFMLLNESAKELLQNIREATDKFQKIIKPNP